MIIFYTLKMHLMKYFCLEIWKVQFHLAKSITKIVAMVRTVNQALYEIIF